MMSVTYSEKASRIWQWMDEEVLNIPNSSYLDFPDAEIVTRLEALLKALDGEPRATGGIGEYELNDLIYRLKMFFVQHAEKTFTGREVHDVIHDAEADLWRNAAKRKKVE